MVQGGTRQAHTAECRERFRTLLQEEGKVQKTHEKRKLYEERMAKKEDRKKRKDDERGIKRRAQDDDIEEERIRDAKPEVETGQKRKAESDDIEQERVREKAAASDEGMAIEAVYGEQAWDDVRGGKLDREEVRKARLEEVEYMKNRGLWRVVPRERLEEGQKVTSVKWVDTNKGTDEKPVIRCRLVARDFRGADRDREDLFAATPPWELKKLLMSRAAYRGDNKTRKILLIDVKKAHLNPECKREVYIELPEEVGAKPDQVGKLEYWLYGFRPAAAAWENHYANKLQSVGFRRGEATPVAFYHKEKDLSLVVHGDDFTFVGDDTGLDWIEQYMKRWYEIKVRARLGPSESDDREATLLGRTIKVETRGITCEADPKHRRLVMEALGLEEDSKSLAVPGSKDEDKAAKHDWEEEPGRNPMEDTKFRAIAARLNYMAADMPDIQYACKEVCRDMSAPTSRSWGKLKKIGRYLVGRQTVVWEYPWKHDVGGWKVYTDSDWAGDVATRKSTSGGVLMLGAHCVKTWSVTQDPLALSSCEAEYYAIVEGAMEAAAKRLGAVVEGATRAIGLQTSAKELGIVADDAVVELVTDSSSAKSFASRRGSGRIRHVEVKWLWLQRAVADGKVRLRKILGTTNPADVCTKYQSVSEVAHKLKGVNVVVKAGRPSESRSAEVGIDASGGLRAESFLERLQRGGPRVAWADAEDGVGGSADEAEENGGAAVREVGAPGADEAHTSVIRGGVTEHQTEVRARLGFGSRLLR